MTPFGDNPYPTYHSIPFLEYHISPLYDDVIGKGIAVKQNPTKMRLAFEDAGLFIFPLSVSMFRYSGYCERLYWGSR